MFVALIGAASAAFDPAVVMVVFIFLLNLTYQCVIAAFIVLRNRQPGLARPFKAFGGNALAGVSALLSFAVLVSCVVQRPAAIVAVAACICAYLLVGRAARRARTIS